MSTRPSSGRRASHYRLGNPVSKPDEQSRRGVAPTRNWGGRRASYSFGRDPVPEAEVASPKARQGPKYVVKGPRGRQHKPTVPTCIVGDAGSSSLFAALKLGGRDLSVVLIHDPLFFTRMGPVNASCCPVIFLERNRDNSLPHRDFSQNRGCQSPNFAKSPVNCPVFLKLSSETGSYQTAHTTI